MSKIKNLTPEQESLIPAFQQKWSDFLSTPIDPEKATATISALYQKAGYPPPKVVFVDSPWATAIAAALVFRQSPSELVSTVRDAFTKEFEKLKAQLFGQLCRQLEYEYEYDVVNFAEKFSGKLANSVLLELCSEYGDPFYSRSTTRLDGLTNFLYLHLIEQPQQDQWLQLINDCRFARLNRQLVQQLDIEQSLLELPISNPLIKPFWFGHINDAALYDYAAAIGIQFDSETIELFLNSVVHLSLINPFREICFVSSRPQFKRDTQGMLHAGGEPVIVFPDGFGVGYFYHGITLPEQYGTVHPNQWQAIWVLYEQNAELRRILIQEIGYARLCQELQAEELDSWREYKLLKLPIYDDYRHVKAIWRSPKEFVEGLEAIYLLKMTCPSTGFIYALRVPPNIHSAREAASWINWETDPELFTVET